MTHRTSDQARAAQPAAHTDVYIALGSNLGDRMAHLNGAIKELRATAGIEVLAVSRIIETAPVGPPGQGPYLNAAAHLRTTLAPRGLLNACLAIEAGHGRRRSEAQRWGARQLDIDLLLYGDQVIDEPGMRVPHPRMLERDFVMIPLVEIAPDFVHPALGIRLQSLLQGALSNTHWAVS
jgi:2-amino-4-hydroxy-6-hydroxymethyldihydropteridine diphosphokinase